jgi:hypothetical protein
MVETLVTRYQATLRLLRLLIPWVVCCRFCGKKSFCCPFDCLSHPFRRRITGGRGQTLVLFSSIYVFTALVVLGFFAPIPVKTRIWCLMTRRSRLIFMYLESKSMVHHRATRTHSRPLSGEINGGFPTSAALLSSTSCALPSLLMGRWRREILHRTIIYSPGSVRALSS